MSGIKLESLRAKRSRWAELSPEEMVVQVEAVKTFVAATQDQLVMHQIDRDAGTDWPVECRRYDAFFSIQGADAVMKISSIGLPNEEGGDGLSVDIHSKGRNVVSQIVGLQAAKSPNSVDREEAFWLSHYSPDQLELLADIIAEAKSVGKVAYEEYFRLG